MKNKLIIVLGMHRSGTSLITRSLFALDFDLGSNLMPAVKDNNDKGFWEDIDICTLNVEMLTALNSNWCNVSMITEEEVDQLKQQGYLFKAIELLQRKLEATSTFAFKDPRVTKLLPFWKEVFKNCDSDLHYIIVLRNPLSVVKSLAKRDDIDDEQSYLLWISHVISSLVESTNGKRVLLDYDLFMQYPDEQMHRVAKNLNLNINPDEFESFKSEFLDQNLRHSVFQPQDLSNDQACFPLAEEIYVSLLKVAEDYIALDDINLQENIKKWILDFQNNHYFLKLTDKLITRNFTLANQIVPELKAVIAYKEDIIAYKEAIIENKDAELALIYNSRSWKITKPLRSITKFIQDFRRK